LENGETIMLKILVNFIASTGGGLKRRWILTIFFLFSILAYSSTGFMYFELATKPDLKWIDAIWWSVVTTTTVGFGDYAPATFYGRVLVGFPTMLLGVSILGYLLSYVASSILESRIREIKGMKQINFSNHIIICRYNSMANTLKLLTEIRKDDATADCNIVLIDEVLDELPDELLALGVSFVKGDPSREVVLHKANFTSARSVVIPALEGDLLNSDHRNLAIVLTVERIRPESYTVVECVNPEHEIFFTRAGCDSIVSLSSLTSQMMIQELLDPGVHSIISELTSNTYGKQFYVVTIDGDFDMYSKVRKAYEDKKMVVLGIRRAKKNHFLPSPGFKIKKDDRIILVGSKRPD
jgi:voltage-gated potassium channel